jgi:hypothetical protein
MANERAKKGGWLSQLFEPRIDFYALMNAHAQTVLAGMEALEQWMHHGANVRCQQVRDLENHADEQKLDLERKLVEAFVTPFDREDIYDLSIVLDEVINSAKYIAREMEALEMKLEDPYLDEMAATLVEGTRCLLQSFAHLPTNLQEAANQATLARKSENRLARVYRTAMRDLYRNDDFKMILKTSEVYRIMLTAAVKIDIVGEKLLHVIVKMS